MRKQPEAVLLAPHCPWAARRPTYFGQELGARLSSRGPTEA